MLTLGQCGVKNLVSRIHVDTVLALRRAYEKLRQLYTSDDSVREFSGYEILILLSADEPRSASDFSSLLSCKPAQITGYVSRLEKLGLLKRKLSKLDKRSFTFQLTKLGRQKADILFSITYESFRSHTNLTETENCELVRLLKQI